MGVGPGPSQESLHQAHNLPTKFFTRICTDTTRTLPDPAQTTGQHQIILTTNRVERGERERAVD